MSMILASSVAERMEPIPAEATSDCQRATPDERRAAFHAIGRAEKRHFILRAAADAFGERGFHAVTIKDIVRRAGIAHGTFYLYFKSKKDVYRALCEELQEQIVQAVLPGDEAGLLEPGADPAALISQRLRSLAQIFEREAAFARVYVYRTAGTDPEFAEQRHNFVQRLEDAIASVLRAGAERGVLRHHDPPVAALCLIGSMDMVIERWLERTDDATQPSLAALMNEAAHFFVAALLSTEGAG